MGELEYVGDVDGVTISFRTKKDGGGDEYASFSGISSGDTLTVSSSPIQSEIKKKTWVTITDSGGDEICSNGKIKACKISIVGEEVKNCDALIVTSFTSGDGALCDVEYDDNNQGVRDKMETTHKTSTRFSDSLKKTN